MIVKIVNQNNLSFERLVVHFDETNTRAGVTVIWAPLSFGHPRSQIPSVLGIPGGDIQNTEVVIYVIPRKVNLVTIFLERQL